jgi:hypothetical protein
VIGIAILEVLWDSVCGLKELGHESSHLSPFGAELKDEW